MKKVILSLAVICFAAFTLSAQVATDKDKSEAEKQAVEQRKKDQERMAKERAAKENQTNPQANNPNAPVISFDKLEHDYGTLAQHGDGNCEFKFTNDGKEPLILSNVRSSCGCTVPTWPRQPVLPGQSEIIKVKYDTKRVGTINKSVYVYSNAKQSPITLKIKGKIEAGSASKLPEKKVEKSGTPVNK